jgi:hypothetical protein
MERRQEVNTRWMKLSVTFAACARARLVEGSSLSLAVGMFGKRDILTLLCPCKLAPQSVCCLLLDFQKI